MKQSNNTLFQKNLREHDGQNREDVSVTNPPSTQGLARYGRLVLILVGFLLIFWGRSALALHYEVPFLSDLFNCLTAIGALIVLFKGFRMLHLRDWLFAVFLAALVGFGMLFTSLFSPLDFFGLGLDSVEQAWLRGLLTLVAALGGLVIMRMGGPVKVRATDGNGGDLLRSILFGLGVGLPLAVLNVLALQITQGHGIVWQRPLAALFDALQPGIVEEVIYRFALWGLLWLALRESLPAQSVSLSGLIAMLVHTYAHFDALLIQAPFVALGMGLVLAVVWGLPAYFLALRSGLESAMAFHWLQDAVRFLAGF